MKPISRILPVLITLILAAACSKKGPDYARHIPKDAGYVMAFDVKSMVTKLNEDSLSVENLLEVLKNEHEPADYTEALRMWNQFKDAGIDFEQKVVLAFPEVNMDRMNVSFQLVGGLKDAAKMEAFAKGLPGAGKVEKEDGVSMMEIGDIALGWNEKTVMIAGAQSDNDYELEESDSAAVAPLPGTDSRKSDLKKYFNLKSDESLASVEPFLELMQEKADVAIFTNSSALAGPGANPFLAMVPKVKELVEGIYSTSTVRFEDGKINFSNQTFAGPKLTELLKKYAGPEVDMSLLHRHPSSQVQVAAAFSFKPELIPAFLKETGLEALANVALSEGGMSIDEVSKALKGDFAVMFSDFNMKTLNSGKDAKFKEYEPQGHLLVAMRIGDQAVLDKILAIGEKMNMIRRNGNRIYQGNTGDAYIETPNLFIGLENGLLLLATDSTLYQQYAAGSKTQPSAAEMTTVMQNKAAAFYANLGGLLKAVPDAMFDSSSAHEKRILQQGTDIFKTLWFNTGNFDGKKINSSGAMEVKPGKNALPQLVRFLMFASREIKEKEQEEEARYSAAEASVQ